MSRMIGVIGGISGEILCDRLHERGLHERGFQCLLIAGREGESGLEKADAVIVEELSHHEEILQRIRALGVSEIILGTGHIVAIELAGYLERHGVLTSNNYEASILAKDKIRYKRELRKLGLNTPKFACFTGHGETELQTALEQVGLPCVVKSSIDRLLPQKCNTEAELRTAFDEVGATDSEILVEEFVDGVDCTIPYLNDMETVTPLMFSYYSKAESCSLKGFGKFESHSLPKETESRVMEYCKAAVEHIPTIGLCRIDAIVTPAGEISILECNSVIVTGIHPNQIDYGLYFIKKEGIDFAGKLVDVSLKIFDRKRTGVK